MRSRTDSATGASAGRRLLWRVGPRDRPAEHRRDERVLRLVRGRPGSDDLAVAQDRHGVGELEHLAEEMRDEDDRPAAGRQAPDDLVEALDLRRRQRGGRLVEDDQLGVAGQRPQDLDLLLDGERQRPDRRVRRHLEAGAGDDAPVAIEQLPPPDEAEPSWLGAEEHVLRDRPLRDHGDLLGDHRDPALERLARRAEAHRLAAQVQLALVLREHARDDLAERGLAGSVLADEGMNGAGADLDRDLVQCARAAERLADPADVEVDLAGSHGADVRTGQPGHSASVRNWSTLSLVTTPPSGRSARTSIPGWTSPPARMASMNICVPRPPSVAGACIVVP